GVLGLLLPTRRRVVGAAELGWGTLQVVGPEQRLAPYLTAPPRSSASSDPTVPWKLAQGTCRSDHLDTGFPSVFAKAQDRTLSGRWVPPLSTSSLFLPRSRELQRLKLESPPEEVWQVVTQPDSQQQHQDRRLSYMFLDKKDWTRNELHESNELAKKLHQSPNLIPSKQQVHTGDLCRNSLMCNLDFTPNAYLARRRFECDGRGNLFSIRNLKLHLQERMHVDVTSVEVF
ncbi:LOW QUALITY PROTEIN: putative protein ZNF815, partial [Trachypithecus francoisi]|uniref:LOW QUALITY PROTEIN: putative protein ZNF815 n=1 Tax=Trachypithecus francoisi TaxID=54180 RepID=UPI00141BE65E